MAFKVRLFPRRLVAVTVDGDSDIALAIDRGRADGVAVERARAAVLLPVRKGLVLYCGEDTTSAQDKGEGATSMVRCRSSPRRAQMDLLSLNMSSNTC